MAERSHHSSASLKTDEQPIKKSTHQAPTQPSSVIQRAIENPNSKTLTPDVVLQIQRTYGNQFAAQLIQRSRSGPDAADGVIQREIAYNPDGTPVLSTIYTDAVKEVVQTLSDIKDRAASTLDSEGKTQIADAIRNLTVGGSLLQAYRSNAPIRAELKKQAQKDLSPEVTNFLDAVDVYDSNPTTAKAMEIFDEYIRGGVAPQEVNIRGGTRRAVANAIQALQIDPSTITTRTRS